MNKEILRNNRGVVIGYIKERAGKVEIQDRRGYNLGYYNPKTNITYSRNGERFGYGNLLTMFLCEWDKE
jgi:hypothetical protein